MMKLKPKTGRLFKNTIWLLILMIVLSLLTLCLRWDSGLRIIKWGINLVQLLLVLSIVSCSAARIKSYLAFNRAGSRPRIRLQELDQITLSSETIRSKLTQRLIRKGFQVDLTGDVLSAHKNRSEFWGSVSFHMGMVLLLAGFFVNFLWGARGILLAPEGVVLNTTEDLQITSRGPLFKAVAPFSLRLERFSYSDETGSDSRLLRPVGSLFFKDAAGESRQQLRVNNPAVFGDIRWRYFDSGYSLLLKIKDPQGVIVNDYANIASNRGKAWADVVEISPGLKIDIKFYPDYAETGNKTAFSKSRFPNNPVMELVVLQNGRTTGQALIPIGQTESIGDLQVSFSGFRYWVLMEAGTDPGRILILFGALISVGGLAWRIMLVSKHFACRVEENGRGISMVSWGVRANFGRSMFREEILGIFREMEDTQSDNT